MLESTQPGFAFAPGVNSILFVDENALGAPGTIILNFLRPGNNVLLGSDANLGVVGSLVIAGPGGAGTPLQVGSFLVTGSASQSNSPGTPGSPTIETITSSSLNVVNNTGATAVQNVVVTDTGFSALRNGTMSSTASGLVAGPGQVVITTVDNGANQLFGGTSVNPGAPGPNLFGFNGTVVTGLYSVTDGPRSIPFTAVSAKSIEFDITLNAGSSLNTRLNGITNFGIPTPEPGTLVALACGLPVAGLMYRNRRKARA